jgi:hypothetical protein
MKKLKALCGVLLLLPCSALAQTYNSESLLNINKPSKDVHTRIEAAQLAGAKRAIASLKVEQIP